jgi:hypothetical protein
MVLVGNCRAVFLAGEGGLTTFVVLLGLVGWLANVAWQLRLSRTEGKVRTRNGYVVRADNPAMFELCVLFYWISLALGIVMLIGVLILAINQILS